MISKAELLTRLEAIEKHLGIKKEEASQLPTEGDYIAKVLEVFDPNARVANNEQFTLKMKVELLGKETVFLHFSGTLDTIRLLHSMKTLLWGKYIRVRIKHRHLRDFIGLQTTFLELCDGP